MEIIQLCKDFSGDGVGRVVKLVGSRIENGPIPIQIYTNEDIPFSATVRLEGTIATEDEINANNVIWSPIGGALWTEPTLDALFVQPTHIRCRITEYVSGSVSIRLGF
jgi:hypothetical protein